MGQVNLYKIDEKKTDDFLNKLDEKFQFLGEQDYPFGNDEKNQCTVMTYANKVENRKLPEWKWILDEYEFEIYETKTYDVMEDVKNCKSEIGVLYINDFNKKVLTKLFHQSGVEFHELLKCHIYVYIWMIKNNKLKMQV